MTSVAQTSAAIFEDRRAFGLVATLIVVLFAVTNFPWRLDDYDQAKQAFTSFEMVNESHWLFQHTPREKVATKPPLVGWISAVIYGVTGSWETAWRLPSFAAGCALLIVLTRAATRAYGAAAGMIAMSAFGLNLLSPRLATLVRTDMPLALVVFLLGLQIWQKVRSAEPWQTRDRFVTFGLLTAAMLIKGPIVFAFLLPGIVVFELWRRRANGAMSAWIGWWPWVASLAIFATWVAAGIAWQAGFHEEVVVKEFAGRFGDTMHRPQPIYFYWPHLLHKFAPWSLLAIGLAVFAWKKERMPWRERWRNLSPDTAWLVLWGLGGLVLMSLIPSKRVDRVFPIVPPLCLLLAAQVSRVHGPSVRKWIGGAVLFACLFTSSYAAHKLVTSFRSDRGALAKFGRAVRETAAANGWRYEVIGGREEGLLLYLRRTRFLEINEVAERWSGARLDAVVAPAEDVPRLLELLPAALPSGLEAAVTIDGRPRRYVLLRRP